MRIVSWSIPIAAAAAFLAVAPSAPFAALSSAEATAVRGGACFKHAFHPCGIFMGEPLPYPCIGINADRIFEWLPQANGLKQEVFQNCVNPDYEDQTYDGCGHVHWESCTIDP